MPGITRRSTYRKGIKERGDLKAVIRGIRRLEEADWAALETALGCQLDEYQRGVIDSFARFTKASTELERQTMPIPVLKAKIRKIRSEVMRHREEIWHTFPKLYTIKKSSRSVEEFFFMRRFRVTSDGPIALLAWAMDALIVTCNTCESEIDSKSNSTVDREWYAYTGAVLRTAFKGLGLPHTIRKDSDKVRAGGESAFLIFYLTLLERIGCPWPLSSTALASAITRIPDGRADGSRSKPLKLARRIGR